MALLTLDARLRSAALNDDVAFAETYVEEFMKTHLPQYYWRVTDEGKREMVINGRRYARYFHIEDSQSQMMFITLMWEIGANFFVFPGFSDVAVSPLPGPAKIDAFYAVDSDLAAAAIQSPDDRYWYPHMVGLEEVLG